VADCSLHFGCHFDELLQPLLLATSLATVNLPSFLSLPCAGHFLAGPTPQPASHLLAQRPQVKTNHPNPYVANASSDSPGGEGEAGER
jgi:hypothetical protein